MTNLFGPGRLHRLQLVAPLAALLAVSAADAADLNGRWRDVSSNTKPEIVHSGDTVTLSPGTNECSGTIDGSNVELTCSSPQSPGTYALVLSADESTLSGVFHTIRCIVSFCQAVDIPVTLERCACFDGNNEDGDGCDLECRIEECHECSGDPSTCTPLADATPCEDSSFCVSGGSCSAGACLGGTTTASCLDLSGLWLRAQRLDSPGLAGPGVFRSNFRHAADGSLTLYSVPDGQLDRRGGVDAAELTFKLPGYGSFPACGTGDLDAVIAPEGDRYTARGTAMAATPRFCLGFGYDEVGVRCAPSALEPADGCRVDSCERCQGEPAVCEPVPDGTPCVPEHSCSLVSVCQEGQCVAIFDSNTIDCQPGGDASVCTSLPREDCRVASTKLAIKNRTGSDRRSMRWDWKDGGTVDVSEIGHPELAATVSFCLYDESVPSSPVLVDFDSVNALGLEAGWSEDARGNKRFRSSTRSITSIDLRAGTNGKMSLKAGSLSSGLPVAEVALPMRAQLQIEDAGCFEGTYDAEDAMKNEDGVFKAKSTP